MTKAIQDGSGPKVVLTRQWSQYVDAGWAGGDKALNGGLYISSRTPKQRPPRLGSGYRTAWREHTGRGVPFQVITRPRWYCEQMTMSGIITSGWGVSGWMWNRICS